MRIQDPIISSEMGIDLDEMSRSQVLRLCVYLIEAESSFSGEGFRMQDILDLFTDQQTVVLDEVMATLIGRSAKDEVV